MKRFIKSKKGLALLAALVVAATAAIGAYAYFTATGNGNGTATVGTSSNELYVVGTTTGPSLTPGGPTETVHFSAYNYASNNESISNIHLASVQACAGGTWTLPLTDTYTHSQLAATCSGTVLPTGPGAGDCGSIADGTTTDTGASQLANDFYMADVAVPPSTDGDIAANASGQALATTGTLAMNDSPTNQNACKNAALLLQFTTS